MRFRQVVIAMALTVLAGCGGGGSSSGSTNGAGPTTPTAAEGITYSKAMVQDLVNTQTTVGTSFWAPQEANVHTTLQGASLDGARYGQDLQWLKAAMQSLDLSGKTSSTGFFNTGLWEYRALTVPPYTVTQGEKKWSYTMTKSGAGYSYAIAKGDGTFWIGAVTGISRWTDGTLQGLTLVNAAFPGELAYSWQWTSTSYSSTYDLKGRDVLNLTLTNTGGSAQSATGTIEGYNLVSATPLVKTTLTSATWDETPTGGIAPNTHAWLPKSLVLKVVAGTYSFDGSIDCANYQGNATAALAMANGPTWGWHALDATGATFTNLHFLGKALNGQGAEADIDFSVAILNYAALRLDLARSSTNAPSVQSSVTAKLQLPSQPLLTMVVTAATNGLYALNSTLDYTFGTSHITGTGVYYPITPGQLSSWRLTATLKNEKGVQFDLKQDLQDKFSGSVSIQGLTIGTIEDVGFGPRVKYIDGSFQSLF